MDPSRRPPEGRGPGTAPADFAPPLPSGEGPGGEGRDGAGRSHRPQTNAAIGSGLGVANASASSSVKVPSNSARPTMAPEML